MAASFKVVWVNNIYTMKTIWIDNLNIHLTSDNDDNLKTLKVSHHCVTPHLKSIC